MNVHSGCNCKFCRTLALAIQKIPWPIAGLSQCMACKSKGYSITSIDDAKAGIERYICNNLDCLSRREWTVDKDGKRWEILTTAERPRHE